MSEETSQATVQTQEANTEITEQNITLDDVYKDAGLDKIETQQPQPQTQPQIQQPTVEPSTVPDPYDTEKFKAYVAQQAAGQTALQQTLGNVTNFLTTFQAKEAKKALESDIKSAVEKVNADVQHPNPLVVEAMLDAEARGNPKFKAIWENRSRNPVALDNALKIISKKIGNDLSVKVDPALVEAQRARKQAQRQMATTTAESESPLQDRLAAAQGADFDSEWQKLLGGA